MKDQGIVSEVLYFLKKERKYWLIPLIFSFLIFAILVIMAETVPVVSPFIYTLF